MTKQQYMNQRQQLMTQAKQFLDAGNLDEFNKIKTQVEQLDSDYEAHAQAQANYAALEGNSVVPAAMQDLGGGAPGVPGVPEVTGGDIFASAEYATAFMNFVCQRTPLPAKFRNEAASTSPEDAGAAIPTHMMQEIITKLEERGLIFQELRQLNIAGGVQIPVADLKPVAKWVGSGASEDQEITAKDKISFSYYGLECKISQDILTSVVTIAAFQKLFVELAVEAIFAAVEIGVFNGTGESQMLGVCVDERVKNVVTMNAEEFDSFSAWKKKVFALIRKRYSRGKFYMAESTFQGHIDGMVDKNGQPVGRTNYGIDANPTYGFGGKRVETTEDDVIAPYDTAAAGDVVAVFMNLKDYVFNSNMKMTVVHWTDHDNNKKKTKVILICDGKIADPNGVILVKKGA
jgi:HK97 family phage major capsid protein